MADYLKQSTRYFKSYEEREEAFRKSAFSLIPRKHLGPGPFWKDFRRISLDGFSKISSTPIAVVTSNPRDCLAFGTPMQVLTAACLSAKNADQRQLFTVAEIAEQFGIPGILNQPVRTLSGGETVKLALAKSYVSAADTTRLAIASPFCWLSRDNISYFKKLFQYYHGLNLPVEIFALEGEDSDRPIEGDERLRIHTAAPVDFSIRLKNVRLRLGTSFNTLYAHHTVVRVDDFSAELSSPCLIVGENGQGKSLVAKILAGAIAFSGEAGITSGKHTGRARLLFQDVVAQTLLRSFGAIAGSCGAGLKQAALDLYGEILAAFYEMTGKPGGCGDAAGDGLGQTPLSLLEIKGILVAVRLCVQPCALILDEPDWGMTRSDAVAFVAAIIRVAHAHQVPVLIISHKPWWLSIAESKIHVARTETAAHGERESAFSIMMRRQAGEAS